MNIFKNTAVTIAFKLFDADSKLLEESPEPLVYLHGGHGGIFPKIEAALRDAELIIPVLSENWIKRDWTRQELEKFLELHPAANDGIVLVLKDEPKSKPRPTPLQGHEGYRFFESEPSGAVREF